MSGDHSYNNLLKSPTNSPTDSPELQPKSSPLSSSISIISIEGNIGSGKSTILASLKSHFSKPANEHPDYNIVFLPEPLNDWNKIIDNKGVPMLKKFYGDKKKYSFPFQMMAYISRLALLKKTFESKTLNSKKRTIIITERCLYTDKHIFAKMLFDDGEIEDVNYQIYLQWFETFSKDYPIQKLLYVNANAKTCLERIKKRGREGEDGISISYLQNCNYYHENMVRIPENCFFEQIKEIDANVNISEILKDENMKNIFEYITQ